LTTNAHDDIPPDPLIDEIRAIRKAISDQFGNDVDRLCDYLQDEQKKHPERLATSRPKRSQETK